MAEVTLGTVANTEEQETSTETDNLSGNGLSQKADSHQTQLQEEEEQRHNEEESATPSSHIQNEPFIIEEPIQEDTTFTEEVRRALSLLDTTPGQETTEEEQREEVIEGEQEREVVVEEREALVEREEEGERENENEGENEREVQVETAVELDEERAQHQQQHDTASTNTSHSSTTNNSTHSQQLQQQQQQQQQEEEEEEETRNTLPEIMVPPSPSVNGNRIRSASTATPSTVNGLLPRSQRVWEMDRQASECRRCHRRFNFLVRRHHCRRCGQIVCDKCSSHRIRLPVEELIEDPMVPTAQYPLLASQTQRVCDTCYREPIRRSSESHSRRSSHRAYPMNVDHSMRRTQSSQSLMIECPVCGQGFVGMQKQEQEEHLQRCLNVGSPPVQSPRYIVYQLSNDSTQIGDECPICFDEFNSGCDGLGDKVSRMICLCSYHQHCLSSWLQRGKGCPVHYDSLQI